MGTVTIVFERPNLPGLVGQTGPIVFSAEIYENPDTGNLRFEYLGVQQSTGPAHRAICEVVLSEPPETAALANLEQAITEAILSGQQSLPPSAQVTPAEAADFAENAVAFDGELAGFCRKVADNFGPDARFSLASDVGSDGPSDSMAQVVSSDDVVLGNIFESADGEEITIKYDATETETWSKQITAEDAEGNTEFVVVVNDADEISAVTIGNQSINVADIGGLLGSQIGHILGGNQM